MVGAASGLYFALTSSSGTWSVDEIRGWQQDAGLKPAKPITLMTLPGWLMSVAYK